MSTILTHPAIPVTIALCLGRKNIPMSLLQMGIIASILPDFDCAALAVGIPYESQFGHRGLTHSFIFALAFALLCRWRLPKESDVNPRDAFMYIFLSIMSHPLLDM